VAVLLSNGLYWAENGARVARLYRTDRYLNASEVTAMDWLARRVQPGETVMNDSPDGSAFLYALEGVRPLFGHVVASPADKGPTQALLLERFHCLDSDVAVREAIDRLGVRYVFLGTGFVNRSFERVQGLRQLSDSPSLRLVYDRDGVQVYEVALRPVAADPVGQCVRPAR
jgi:hypothetical protein